MTIKAPFGQWSSPITAGLVSEAVRLTDVRFDRTGEALAWCENRSGKGLLFAISGPDAPRQLTLEPPVRGGVGYGGGEFDLRAGVVVFAGKDGRLYRRELSLSQPVPITPSIDAPRGGVASPAISPDGHWVVYVFSDGNTDLIGIAAANGSSWPVQLTRGADFYMQPAWHPGGDYLAWVEWDHPNMPWDGSRLMLGRLAQSSSEGGLPTLVEKQCIAGGPDKPVFQPEFSPDGRYLSFITNPDEWDEFALYEMETGETRTLYGGDEVSMMRPAWGQGMRAYAWLANSQSVIVVDKQHRQHTLTRLNAATGESTTLNAGPYTTIKQISASSTGEELLFIGSAPNLPDEIVRWNSQNVQAIAASVPALTDPAYYSLPQLVSWRTPDQLTVYGWYYPPANPQFENDGLPPTIISIHGGPTDHETMSFDAERAYFTSRGYAFFELNYRGSTGAGKTFRNALEGRWGAVDVEDAVDAAQALVEQSLADPARLIIMGGSAGGYTVLNALVQYPGRFKAGVCRYGISNLFNLVRDTHKFEAHYTDRLIGVLPEAAASFHEWSAVYHCDQISDPLAIFQGKEDTVVPPNQSEDIIAGLRQRGIPHIYRLYEGEGHGFRKSETIEDYLQQTERFLQQHVLFAP